MPEQNHLFVRACAGKCPLTFPEVWTPLRMQNNTDYMYLAGYRSGTTDPLAVAASTQR